MDSASIWKTGLLALLICLSACGGGSDATGDAAPAVGSVPVAEGRSDAGGTGEAVAVAGGVGGDGAVSVGAEVPAAAVLSVRVRGSLADGLGPTLQVRVDGLSLGSTEVRTADFADFRFPLPAAAASAARVDVIFSNGTAAAHADRQLDVESVTVAEQILQPTAPGAVIDLGNAQRVYDGSNVIPGQTRLVSDAALRLRVKPAATPVPSTAVRITDFGAVCDGRFDNSPALARAIASAKTRGLPVSIPVGTCAYGEVIRLDGVKMIGAGDTSVLHALNWRTESIFMSGDGAELRQLKLTGVRAPSRQAAWEMTRVTLFGATHFIIDRLTIEGSAAAGIQTAQSTRSGKITNNLIKDTLADSIHLTDQASDITVENNRIENAGDDGIAVVSYRSDGGRVHHITARNNIILNNRWGRQMSVVGGSDILYENNYLENNLAAFACLYLAQEAPYASFGVSNVVAQHNTLKNCGGSTTGHGAVMVYSDGEEANTDVSLIRNDVIQSGQPGIRVFSALNRAVRVDSNRVQGAGPATDISSPGVTLIPYTSGTVGFTMP